MSCPVCRQVLYFLPLIAMKSMVNCLACEAEARQMICVAFPAAALSAAA